MSTAIHELAHVFRRDIAAADLAIAARWAGVKEGEHWHREAEEKFARAFERYLRSGRAPTPELQSVFAKFKNWLTEIYRSIAGSPIDVDVSPEIRAVLDLNFRSPGPTLLRQFSAYRLLPNPLGRARSTPI